MKTTSVFFAKGEAGGLALVVFGVLLMVVGGVRVHLKRRR